VKVTGFDPTDSLVIAVARIIDRHRAGESVAQLAADYHIAGDVIEGVLRWGLDAAKAA
jgi:uncharacterized protein (DUF433 family)